MARKNSTFEYDLVPFSQFDLNQPVVQLVEAYHAMAMT